MATDDVRLMAHLLRRAGFGATRRELERYESQGYEAAVDELLAPAEPGRMGDDLVRRYHHEYSGLMGQTGPGATWLYRMISTDNPLQEKMALFWHGLFATGYPKITNGKVMLDQLRMFRRYGLGSFKTLLVELSKDPAMIIWLDNQDNHTGTINENYGRELLELFSLGVGNYTEDDVKECARAFTGWTIGNMEYMKLRAIRDSIWPYGRISWHFRYREEDHDDGEKTFLGETGRFNGEDIIEIICRQEATAKFLARHMYHYFVADEPPVPQWPYTPPRNPAAVDALAQAYFDSGYDITAMLRVLFTSDFFRSQDTWYEKVKSPADLMAGVLRLTGEYRMPERAFVGESQRMTFMGQQLANPPSVEGWHQGTEWVDTGTLVERINFATGHLGKIDAPGVRSMIRGVCSQAEGPISPEGLVDACLDQMGARTVSDDTKESLLAFASKRGDLEVGGREPDEEAQRRVAEMLQLVAATTEFQRA